MIIEYHIIDGASTIQFKNDDRYENNTQRLGVSGWYTEN